jgi:hypothetical protein
VTKNIAISARILTIFTQLSARSLDANSLRLAQSIWSHQFWRKRLKKLNLTTEEIEVRVWGIVVLAVTLILFFIVIALLYSVTFIVQPIKSMSPVDQAYVKMMNDIVLLIVGGIGGVIGKRAMTSRQQPPQQPMCQPMGYQGSQGGFNPSYGSSYASPQSAYGLPSQPFGAMPVWKNPELDESWTPGPPPTTPPDHLEDDHEREELAQARKEAE